VLLIDRDTMLDFDAEFDFEGQFVTESCAENV
jgi:hypothetical protein